MRINIKNFKNVITKATLNFGIETLQLRFSDRIQSNMLNSNGTCVSILNVENNVLDTNEALVFNFSDPANNVIPFIMLYDNEQIDLSLTDLFMKFIDNDQITKVGFCSDAAVRLLGSSDVQNVDWIYEMPINIDLIKKFDKIKKIGARFGKVYFTINDHKLYIETSDKTNRFSNGLKFKLADNIDVSDISIVYGYTDMVNFFHCIEMNLDKNFILKISYDTDQGLGCIYTTSENGEEKYALISRAES
jgi:hypothetical protein